jgi:hypothetical protein
MNPTKTQFSDSDSQSNPLSRNDIQICTDFTALMRSTAEKCRQWSEESTSPVCIGGFGTSAFVCDALVKSMEACMGLMGAGAEEPAVKKDCCS